MRKRRLGDAGFSQYIGARNTIEVAIIPNNFQNLEPLWLGDSFLYFREIYWIHAYLDVRVPATSSAHFICVFFI